MKLQTGTIVRFKRPDGAEPVDIVRDRFISETRLLPYAPNENHSAITLTHHSWCHEDDILEVLAQPEDTIPKEWRGMDAINMAETPGRMDGPGFERTVVKDWVKAAGGIENVIFKREWNVVHPDYPNKYPPHCWMWSMMTLDGRYGFRFTRPRIEYNRKEART